MGASFVVGFGAGLSGFTAVTYAAWLGLPSLVLVRGKLVADRDFGAGYVYELLIEDASVTIE